MLVAVIVLLFLPRLGRAHTPGLSTAEFDVSAGGPVEARLTFASAEPLGGTALRDEDLRAFVLQGVDVTADGARCEAAYRGASVTEVDGLQLEAIYDCPAGAREIGVVLYYLSALRPGHREVARIVGPPGSNATVEQVLSGDRRALQLELPASPDGSSTGGKHDRLARRLVVLSAVFAVVMLSLFVWRWRATRRG
jgi:hypothetical protein